MSDEFTEFATWREKIAHLTRETQEHEIEWKAARDVQGKTVQCLAYLTARSVQDRFDETFGPSCWQVRGQPTTVGGHHGYYVEIGVLAEGAEGPGWVWKGDVAQESDVEGLKGAYSGAMKRAAVQWGFGRDLYSLPDCYMPLMPQAQPGSRYYSNNKTQVKGHWHEPVLEAVKAALHTNPFGGQQAAPGRAQAPQVRPQQQGAQPPRQAPPQRPQQPPSPQPRGETGALLGLAIGGPCSDAQCQGAWPCTDHALCPNCGGAMWDNRLEKRNPKAPDFKCKDRTCVQANDGSQQQSVYWPGQWASHCADAVAASGGVASPAGSKGQAPDEIPF